MPILIYDNQEAVPDDVRKDATEVKEGDNKGKWQINLVSRKGLEQFRDNNVQLSEKNRLAAEALSQFRALHGVKDDEELDFAALTTQLTELRATEQGVKDGKIKKSEDIDRVVAERMELANKEHQAAVLDLNQKLGAIRAAKEQADVALDRTYIDREVSAAALSDKLGVHPSAVADLTLRAYEAFEVQKDKTLLNKKNGTVQYGLDGQTPRSVAEWINNDARERWPHYFKQSAGGGAGGGDGTKNFGGMAEADFLKLPPDQRLAIWNKANPSGGSR